MKLDLTNLNWDNATVFNFNYIYYLALMLNERTNEIGFNTQIDESYGESFNINNYEPNGFFRYKQLYDIYVFTLFIGQNYYFNENNLSNSAFKNGHRVKHFSYTLDQLSEIADFDFTKNPLIPHQRLDYYNKFLKPLYLLLKEYKKIWINAFVGKNDSTLYYGYNNPVSAYVTRNNIPNQYVTGQDRLDYYTLSHAQANQQTLNSTSPKITFLGGLMFADYDMFYSFGYQIEKEIPPEPPEPPSAAGWRFTSANAAAHHDYRHHPPEMQDFASHKSDVYVTWTGNEGSNGNINWTVIDAHSDVYWCDEDQDYNLVWVYQYTDDKDVYDDSGWANAVGTSPQATIDKLFGQISITFWGQTITSGFVGTPVNGDVFTLSLSGCTVSITYFEPEPEPEPEPTPGRKVITTESDYATNYEGLKFSYYATLPSGQVQCPIPLVSGGTYDLYMYSFTYPINKYGGNDSSVHGKILAAFEDYAPMWGIYNRWLSPSPLILLQPYGNYFKLESGTLNGTFNYFNISLPNILPYNDSVFSDYPVKMMGSTTNYQQVDYVPVSYDTSKWQVTGSTPARNYKDDPLTPGVYLSYIGPRAELQTSRRGCYIEWWYKPLLVVDYSSIFQYN